MYGTISTFLKAFQGVRDLFITLPRLVLTLDLWHTIAYHKSTLTRFVYRQRVVNFNENSPHFEEEINLLNLSLLLEDRAKLD